MAPWNTVNRWLVEYEAVPSAGTTESIPHRIMAVSAPGDFYSMAAHFPPSNPWQVDPFCQEFFIHQGGTCHRWPFSRTYSEGTIKAGNYMPGSTWMDSLFAITPRWPLVEYKMPPHPGSGAPVILVEAVRSADYRLLANSESVGGEDCAVFDNKGIERIWIATNKGLCLMRRDRRDLRSKKLLDRILTDKVDQVALGLWLQTEYRVQLFRAGQGTNENIMERENKIRIVRCVLNNDVPESTFIPIHRPGSLKYDDAQHFTQVSPGGEDLLSDIVNFMAKYAHLPTKPIPRNHPYAWLLVGLAGGSCVGFFVFPMRKSLFMKAKVHDTSGSAPCLML